MPDSPLRDSPLREAIVHALDASASSSDEVTEVLVSLLVAHLVSEGADPFRVARRLLDEAGETSPSFPSTSTDDSHFSSDYCEPCEYLHAP